MRLPALAVPSALLILSAAAAPVSGQQRELQGGLTTTPPQITTIDAQAAPHTTEAAPQPFGYESEVHCFGYIGPEQDEFVAAIVGAQNSAEQTDFTDGDLVYIDAGHNAGIKPADEFWLVTPGDDVIHPLTNKSMGRFYQYRGRATVVCIEGRTAILRITLACTDIPMGTFLKPYEPVPIPLGRRLPPNAACDPPNGKVSGRIVYTRDGVVASGNDSNVFIDLGVASGIQPGDQLTIFRHAGGEAEYGIRPQGSYWVYTQPAGGVEVPRTYLGDLAVLYVGDRWAMARIIDASRLIEVGDQVELK
jgi:hypothetical protein